MKNTTLLFILSIFINPAHSQVNRNILLAGGDSVVIFSGVSNGFLREVSFLQVENLSAFYGFTARVTNTGTSGFRIEGWYNTNKWCGSGIYLEPGEYKQIQLFIYRARPPELTAFTGMIGMPGGTVSLSPINPASISKLTLTVYTAGSASLTISRIRTYGQYIDPQTLADSPGFYPFIDMFGQYKHLDWTGKTASIADLQQAINTEEEDLSAKPGPAGRDRFGGWTSGPALTATGHFRTEKVDGKWWLVDPDGNLFWSHGVTTTNFYQGITKLSQRENYFEDLPGTGDPEAAFYSQSGGDSSFNFFGSNLYKKYGPQWKDMATLKIPRRIKSWGLNCFGAWADPQIYLYNSVRIPYTIATTSGTGKFPNVYDPAFRSSVAVALSKLDSRVKTDPYFIGIFIDNELNFSNLTGTIMSYASDNPSKLAFIEFLKAKYITIQSLNTSWNTSYASFNYIASLTSLPSGASADKNAFDIKVAEQYFRVCSEEVKKYSQYALYLGSRMDFHFYPDYDISKTDIIRAAAQYCDIVSFNRYRFSIKELILPYNIDKPVIIGEFHFGALDRGLPYAGMRYVADQEQRADAYYGFVKEALENPQVVGTHWFQFNDMPYTGRNLNGANAQVGFVDICDNPYPETVEAARKIGSQMYEIRNSVQSAIRRPESVNNDFMIYPNPSDGNFKVRFYAEGNGDVIMSLYNIKGTRLAEISKFSVRGMNEWEINRKLPSGFYWITLMNNKRLKTGRLIVN